MNKRYKNVFIKNLPTEERPREKLIDRGVEHLTTQELVAIILGTGTRDVSAKGLAERVMSHSEDGLRYFLNCMPEELTEIPGIGMAKACNLIAAFELGKRMALEQNSKKDPITGPKEAAGFVMEQMRYIAHEEFWILLLKSDGRPISTEKVTSGILDETIIHPREIFNIAIRKNAASIILFHNHPSGNPEPSTADINVTKRMVNVGKLLGIEIRDHIIIGDGEFVSLRERQEF